MEISGGPDSAHGPPLDVECHRPWVSVRQTRKSGWYLWPGSCSDRVIPIESTLCISYNNITSVFTNVKYRVPQGSVLGPCSSLYIFHHFHKLFTVIPLLCRWYSAVCTYTSRWSFSNHTFRALLVYGEVDVKRISCSYIYVTYNFKIKLRCWSLSPLDSYTLLMNLLTDIRHSDSTVAFKSKLIYCLTNKINLDTP